jgi:hypothetical protein
MLKEVVDVFFNFPTPTCFGIWLSSSEGRGCLISYSSNVLCYGRVRIMTRPVWPVVVVENLERIKNIHHFLEKKILILFTDRYRKWIIEIDYSELQKVFKCGCFVWSLVGRSTIRPSAHTVYLWTWCGFENKPHLFPFTALTVWV